MLAADISQNIRFSSEEAFSTEVLFDFLTNSNPESWTRSGEVFVQRTLLSKKKTKKNSDAIDSFWDGIE
jgi:hypothetical protein